MNPTIGEMILSYDGRPWLVIDYWLNKYEPIEDEI